MSKGIIYRNAPAPKPWELRVFETLQHVVRGAIDQEILSPKDEFVLWQGIMDPKADAALRQEMKDNPCDGNKVLSQNLAVEKYLNGENWDAVSDAEPLMIRFKEVVERLNFPYIKKNINTLVPWEVFAKFVIVRHGEKDESNGNLTSKGQKEAFKAGEKIKEENNDMMPTGYFTVQQPINQMIMMALLAGKNCTTAWNNKNLSRHVRNKDMPAERKSPYETSEITNYELALSEQFNVKKFNSSVWKAKNDYLTESLVIMIERKWHKEQFLLSNIDTYFATLHDTCI
jgi:hypothetical protein